MSCRPLALSPDSKRSPHSSCDKEIEFYHYRKIQRTKNKKKKSKFLFSTCEKAAPDSNKGQGKYYYSRRPAPRVTDGAAMRGHHYKRNTTAASAATSTFSFLFSFLLSSSPSFDLLSSYALKRLACAGATANAEPPPFTIHRVGEGGWDRRGQRADCV